MYGSIRHQIRIRRSAADVWALAGDPTQLHTWFPGIVDCKVEGTMRVITTGIGLPMPEQIVLRDDAQRRFQYEITAPMFRKHRGTIDVIELDADECMVVYSTDCEPRAMALVISACADWNLANAALSLISSGVA